MEEPVGFTFLTTGQLLLAVYRGNRTNMEKALQKRVAEKKTPKEE